VNKLERKFTISDQEWFAQVSGDTNPLHLDAAFASRTFPGVPVVHGVHSLLWAMDQRCAAESASWKGAVRASFIKPILLDDLVSVHGSGGAIRLLVRGETMAVATLIEPPEHAEVFINTAAKWTVGAPPLNCRFDELSTSCGEIELPTTVGDLGGAFPHLVGVAGCEFVCGLVGVSTLVGMVCPGLHSVLSELTLSAAASVSGRGRFVFKVVRHDRRFRRIQMAVNAPGFAGTVAAFTGHSGAEPAAATIRSLVPSEAFRGQSPLIIGATSGLGSVSARLLAAGGACPVLGYRDYASVDAVLGTVLQLGAGKPVPFDATDPAEGLEELAAMGWSGNEVYYFASPRIFRRRIEPYQAEDLRDFLRIFVDGFYETVRGLLELRDGEALTIFYPSTTALDEATAELFEYRIAKQAGEELCQRLREKFSLLTIISDRLPRLATRQTITFVKVPDKRPEVVMAPIVRRVQASNSSSSPP